ncbi:MAG TPA: HlyD family efflux transporter periplasmic adaptor subunit [Pirellulales bacterium]|nr:HlyD family efflux transporter periplasmic adaptor subunit [Pirellulales bacterium]
MATETIPRLDPQRREAGPQPAPRRPRRSRPLWRMLLTLSIGAAVVAASAYGLKGWFVGEAVVTRNELTRKVARGNLLVTITASGNIESSRNIDVKCEVAGGSTILWIVPDGTQVNEGDELVRLDSALIAEQVDLQKIAYEKAQALKIEAEKTASAAKIAVQEYSEGTYLQAVQSAEVAITVAQENLRSAENSFQFAQKMARKGYVTSLERDARAFAVQRAKLDMVTAQLAKEVLEKFTKPKTEEDLISKRDTAEAKMRSEEAAFDLEESRLKRLQIQLEKCVIKAPQAGMVIYANEPGGQRGQQAVQIEEGAAVRERQSIIRLPDLARMQVKIPVHESKVDQLRVGMRANLKVQDREFQGTVASVANQPEPNPFLSTVKEYATIVKINGESSGLRPGMTAVVEILVAELNGVLTVPVEAIVEQGGHTYCWVLSGGSHKRRQVVLGMSNNVEIEVKDGLVEGDVVILNPRAIVTEARDDDDGAPTVDVKQRFGDAPPPGAAGQEEGGGRREGRGSGRPRMNIMEFDKDGDKKVSREEAPEPMQARFDRIDTDGDGFIDAKEAAAAAARRRKMEAEGGGGPGGPGGP